MIIEQHYVGRHNMLHLGTKSDRVILYHPKTYEEVIKDNSYITVFIDLLTDKNVKLHWGELQSYTHLSTHLS